MILVIADDLTGATELSGIGLQYGLSVEVSLDAAVKSHADMLIIAMDTRSVSRDEAIDKTRHITRQIRKLKPDFIFKKVDSVLRGYISDEINVHLEGLNLPRALVVPCNPALGRVIIDGNYYLNDTLLHLSSFANDPEFSLKTSDVKELLKHDDIDVTVRKSGQLFDLEGLIIGEARDQTDLKNWVDNIDAKTFIAGAAGFFTAILDGLNVTQSEPVIKPTPKFRYPALVVSGTAYADSCNTIKKLKHQGQPVSYMPADILYADTADLDFENWGKAISNYIDQHGKAFLAVDPEMTGKRHVSARLLREKTAHIVKWIFERNDIAELIIEGGSTAAGVLRALGISKLHPVENAAPGVIKMRNDKYPALHITLKPGSYPWPGHYDFEVFGKLVR